MEFNGYLDAIKLRRLKILQLVMPLYFIVYILKANMLMHVAIEFKIGMAVVICTIVYISMQRRIKSIAIQFSKVKYYLDETSISKTKQGSTSKIYFETITSVIVYLNKHEQIRDIKITSGNNSIVIGNVDGIDQIHKELVTRIGKEYFHVEYPMAYALDNPVFFTVYLSVIWLVILYIFI